MSCPRATTRTAFARLANHAIGRADPGGEQAASFCRTLLPLLAEERPGAARWASPGGLTHLAEVTAAAAAASSECSKVLAAGDAVRLLLACLKSRHVHEARLHPNPPAQQQQQQQARLLQDVGGFGAVVSAIGQVLAVRATAREGPGRSSNTVAAAAAVADREFLMAALQAFPREAGDILVNLVWRGGGIGEGEAHESVVAELSTPAIMAAGDKDPVAGGDQPSEGEGEDGVSERALDVLLDIVKDASRSAEHVGAAMAILSRVLHLRDGFARERLEAALDTLGTIATTTSDKDAGSSWEGTARGGGSGGSGGSGSSAGAGVYLTGKLIASLFVHMPEVRSVLRYGAQASSGSASLLGSREGRGNESSAGFASRQGV